MYLVLKFPRQEFLSRWATVLIIFSSRTSKCASNEETSVFLIACENIRFSSLFADGDVLISRGGTSATERQKSAEKNSLRKRMFPQAIFFFKGTCSIWFL